MTVPLPEPTRLGTNYPRGFPEALEAFTGEQMIAYGEACAAEARQDMRAAVQHEADCVDAAKEEIERLRAEVEALRRGEFICKRCGLRKDAEQETPEF